MSGSYRTVGSALSARLVDLAARAHGADHRQIILDRDHPVELDAGLAGQRPDNLGGDPADDRHAEYHQIAGFQPALIAHQQAVGADVDAGAHFLPPVGQHDWQAAIALAAGRQPLVESYLMSLARIHLAHVLALDGPAGLDRPASSIPGNLYRKTG